MRKIPIDRIPDSLPPEIESLTLGAGLYDSSCSPEARVYFIDKDAGYYLKCAPAGALASEAAMARYFYGKGIGAEVLSYTSGAVDCLLTARADGNDCTHGRYLSDPDRLAERLAQELRALHETNSALCPVPHRTRQYLALAKQNYRAGKCDLSLFSGMFDFGSAEEAYAILEEGKDALRCEVLIHGDYCLPNIILRDWRLSAFIDLGNGGVGDRHIDLFWGAWTLWFNLKTDRYRARFLDAYGRDKIEEPLLRVVAAAEVFG